MGRITYMGQIPFGSKEYMAASEQLHQFAFLEWLRKNHMDLAKKIFAIPNGGSRNKIEATRMKCEGVKAGVPDLMLPHAQYPYHGLFIEMKSMESGTKPSEKQIEVIAALRQDNYAAFVCHGWGQAAWLVTNYMRGLNQYAGRDEQTGMNLFAQMNGEYGAASWR